MLFPVLVVYEYHPLGILPAVLYAVPVVDSKPSLTSQLLAVAFAVRVRVPVILVCVYCKSCDTRVEPLYQPSKSYPELTVALNVALPPLVTVTLVAVPEKELPTATYALSMPVPADAVTV